MTGALREWRCYLEGRPFTLVTDHKPNTYLDETNNVHTMQRRARWPSESSRFDYVWRYRPGRINVADPISRAPQHFALLCGVVPTQVWGQCDALLCPITTFSTCADCACRFSSGTDSHVRSNGTVLASVIHGAPGNAQLPETLSFLRGGVTAREHDCKTDRRIVQETKNCRHKASLFQWPWKIGKWSSMLSSMISSNG
jgi:hypothetical protein